MTETELVQAANGMFELLIEPPSTLELHRAATIGCETLRNLVKEQWLFEQIDFLGELQANNQAAFRDIAGAKYQTLDHFRYFLDLDKKLMLLAGLQPDLVSVLARQAENLIEEIRQGSKDAYELRNSLLVLRQKTCDLADELCRNQRAETHHHKKRAFLVGVVFAVGGAAVISINAAPTTIGGIGLSAAGMAVSGAVGGVLIDKAWDIANS